MGIGCFTALVRDLVDGVCVCICAHLCEIYFKEL